MLPTETANLPKTERLRLHPDFVANEQAYLRMRDALLATHRGQSPVPGSSRPDRNSWTSWIGPTKRRITPASL